MSILINGMEMPTKQTTLTIFPNGYVAIYDAKDSFVGETRCVPVPEHGRLIDADDFFRTFPELIPYEFAAPTIIPAEPPKEETE